MALNKEQKKEIILNSTNSEINTGSIQAMIDLLSCEIEELNKHLKQHPFDFHSKRGLLTKNKKRSIYLKYLKSKSKL
ncbi:30S ribosomal protein S15 [Candidatus Phytoplasma rubi]|uniref:30S ribosomal protein S15 n=1 Tax=Candidatus Phytoplasma rubi TaxID=399025 RepID=A0ABY7BT48_9MOLU|nr:30S ribosomal protein S15 [Candidatus Phytoplasma rubi]WAN63247.1 30S ribosomal protein S15 [Candidatus Phytoplasma rubi]